MTAFDPEHAEVLVTREPSPIDGVAVYTVLACRGGCVVQRWTKSLADHDPQNIVTTLGELVLQGLGRLEADEDRDRAR